jgi:hypothetical protein
MVAVRFNPSEIWRSVMKNRMFAWAARTIAVLVMVAVGAGALAENPKLQGTERGIERLYAANHHRAV